MAAREQERKDLSRHRVRWRKYQRQIDPARRVFLPNYSPDLNPSEQVFAKLRTLLRKAAARSLNVVSEGANQLKNAGYAST